MGTTSKHSWESGIWIGKELLEFSDKVGSTLEQRRHLPEDLD